MPEKSILRELKDIQLAIELISLGARLQVLESETSLSRGRLLKLYKELKQAPPPKGMLPFSANWFLSWEQNIHASMFYNIYLHLQCKEKSQAIDALTSAYRLYIEQCHGMGRAEPLLGLTRSWMLLRFIENSVLAQTTCGVCKGKFITYAYQPAHSFICCFCHPPSRAVKKRKLFAEKADIKFRWKVIAKDESN